MKNASNQKAIKNLIFLIAFYISFILVIPYSSGLAVNNLLTKFFLKTK